MLLTEGHELHLKDLQKLRDNAKVQRIFARKQEKNNKNSMCREINKAAESYKQYQEKTTAKKLPPLFPSSTGNDFEYLINI